MLIYEIIESNVKLAHYKICCFICEMYLVIAPDPDEAGIWQTIKISYWLFLMYCATDKVTELLTTFTLYIGD